MTADIENPVLEPFQAIRAALADLKREVAGNTLQIAALGQQLGAWTTAVYGGKSELDDIKRRVELREG